MKLIYIAGPYRPYTCADGTWVGTSMNTRNAEVTAVNLVNELGHLGLFPVVPHLNTRGFESQVKKNSDQYFLDGTMAILERCDAVLLTMPDADVVSVGTKAEVHRAHQLGIQVYRSFDSLRRAAQENQIVRLPPVQDFSKLEERVLTGLIPASTTDVRALDLNPGDVTIDGKIVNYTEQREGENIDIHWVGGGCETCHYLHPITLKLRANISRGKSKPQ